LCEVRTLESEQLFGQMYELCDSYGDCLCAQLELNSTPGPAKVLFNAFVATVAVLELDYFDLDYRSEFSATHELSFAALAPQVSRLHFFNTERPGKPTSLRDFVSKSKSSYLGYVVIRPQDPPSIGRSLVSPVGICEELAEPTSMAKHVRTAVNEHTELFGVPLCAVGVPFMEQDGHLLRCAHVTAWMTHYTSVLRGVVPRRPSAHFNSAEDPLRAYGRSYPSDGLTSFSQGQILRKLDLPPEVVDEVELMRPRALSWYDRKELIDAVSGEDLGQTLLNRIWLAENLTSTICRYLNSGIPVILNCADHSQVVCGYFREEDMAESSIKDRPVAQTDVVAFLVQDDQIGPYRMVRVEKILDQVLNADEPVSVLIPLPRGLWLSGQSAEIAGATVFASIVKARCESYAQRPADMRPPPEEFESVGRQLGSLIEVIGGRRHDRLAIRTYAMTGSDFKQEFATRIEDEEAAKVLGYTRLPKYVWVVEILDKDLRAKDSPAVIGTVILDGSAVSDGVTRPPRPLMAQMPGQISRIQYDVYAEGSWVTMHSKPYFSGRWNHDDHYGLLDADRVASRSKTAMVTVTP
jgi:hypothetical protein